MLAISPSTLASRAMLVRLTITTWGATKLDRKITDEINNAHNAAPDAGRYNKRLISKNALAEIKKIESAARAEFYKRTSPWENDGTRILLNAGFDEFSDVFRNMALDHERAADAFADGYPDYVTDARLSLNGLFNESDYPSPSVIRRKFSFKVKVDPLPDAADFRVTLSESQAADIKADIETRTRAAVADAMRDVWQRVADNVGHMAERLAAFKPAAKRGEKSESIFRDSLVDNVRELVKLLPSLNITGDAKLADIAARMDRELCGLDAEDLRNNPTQRENVAKSAEAISAAVAEYLA